MSKTKDKRGLQYLQFKSQIKLIETKEDGDKGIVEAYVSIFDNVDSYGDKIVKGAFSESLQRKLPVGVWMHEWDKPIAKTLEAREDNIGLFIKGQFNLETQRGREAFSDLKNGIIDEFSIGFSVVEEDFDNETGVRILKKIKLYEWSPVLAGANPKTELVSVKSEDEVEEEVEVVESEDLTEEEATENETETEEELEDEKSLNVKILDKLNEIDKKLELLNKNNPVLDGGKVGADLQDSEKVLRIRQAIKQIDKTSEYLLRITK